MIVLGHNRMIVYFFLYLIFPIIPPMIAPRIKDSNIAIIKYKKTGW